MPAAKAELQEFIKNSIQLAGTELMRYFGSGLTVSNKPDESLVTEADLASERIVIDAIRREFPDDIICSEESGLSSADRTAGRGIWIIDPLDGTTNFANNYPYFCVSVGRGVFDEKGRIQMVAAGIEDPARNKTYLAVKGGGASVNGQTMRVRPNRPLKSSFLVTGFYYNKGEKLKKEVQRFHRVAEICSSIRRDGAAALDLALVAEGVFDAFWELGLKPWDVAAGSLLIEEAKGVVINYDAPLNTPFDIEGDGVISGSQGIVEELLGIF